MYIDFEAISSQRAYVTLTQTIIPRPIAWILSENENGSLNLAPFSFFNAVCSQPPLLSVSIGLKSDGSLKDTRLNILQRKHFVLHIAHENQLPMVDASAMSLPTGESEIDVLGLETVAFENFSLPRLVECRVAYACHFHSEMELGTSDHALLLGQVSRLYVDDAMTVLDAKGRVKIEAMRLAPLARLGTGEYSHITAPIHLQ